MPKLLPVGIDQEEELLEKLPEVEQWTVHVHVTSRSNCQIKRLNRVDVLNSLAPMFVIIFKVLADEMYLANNYSLFNYFF